MALEWLKQKPAKEPEAKGDEEFELKPKDVHDKLAKVDGLETSLNELKAKSGTLDRMAVFLDEQEHIKATKKTEDEKKRRQEAEGDLEDEFLTDPAAATRKMLASQMNPLITAQVNTSAGIIMRDLFSGSPDEFEYANDPTIKKEVEQRLMTLPLDQRANPESIRNCYYVVEGRHRQEIKEGKIKSSLSAAGSSGNGKGAPTARQDEVVILSDAEKRAAKIFGMKDEDYGKSKKELSYV